MRKSFLLLLLPILTARPSSAVKFDLRDAIQRNSLLAISEAPLERTTTLSRFVTGMMELDPDNLANGIKGEIEMDTRTLDFGTELKNIQIREQFLNVAEYPLIRAVVMTQGLKGKLAEGQPSTLKLDAELSIRGVTKKIKVPLQLTYLKESEATKLRLPGNLLRIRGRFDLDSSEFGITIPDNLKPVLNKNIQVALEIFGSDRPPVAVPALPEGPKPK